MKDLKLSLIVAAIDRATAPLRRIGTGLKGLEDRAGKLHKAFKKLGMAEFIGGALFTGTALEAGRGIYELTNKTAELGEGFLHSAIKAGATVEQMQRLGFAAKQLGVDQDGLSQVFFRFQTHLANAVKGQKEARFALKELGIPLKDLKALSKDPMEAFLRMADGFHKMTNPTLRAKVAMDLFSRSGYQVLPMLAAGREEIERFMGQLDAAHAVMTTADAKASEEFIQKKNQMGLALQGLQIQIGRRLIPVFTAAIDKTTAWIEHLKPAAFDRFTSAIDALVQDLPRLLPFIDRAVDASVKLADGLLKLSENAGVVKTALLGLAVFVGLQFLIAFVQVAATVAGAVVAFGEFVGVIGSLIALAAGVTTFADAMALLDLAFAASPIGIVMLIVAAVAALAGAAYWVVSNWSGIAAWWDGLWKKIKGPVELMFPVIGLFAEGFNLIKKNWSGITGFFGDLFKRLGSIFSDGWAAITKATPDWLKTLLKIGGVAALTAFSPVAGAVAAGAAFVPVAPAPAPPRAGAPGKGAPADSHHKIDLHLKVSNDGNVRAGPMAATADATLHVERGPLVA